MIRINNFLALMSSLVFVVVLRFENSPNSNEFTFIVYWISLISMILFGSMYMYFQHKKK